MSLDELRLEIETLSGDDVDRICEGTTVAELVASREAAGGPPAGPSPETKPEEPDEGAAPSGYPHPAGSPA